MANVPQLGAPGGDDDSQEMPTCKRCGQAIFFEHAADCPAIRQPRKGDALESTLAEAWWRGRRSVIEGIPKTESTGPELVKRCRADIGDLFAPECGEDHEVGSRPNHCFACLSEQRDKLLAALKAAQPQFCSMKCPSIFKGPDSARHIAECVAMQAAINETESR